MKKSVKLLSYLLLIFAYSLFLSIGMECLLCVLFLFFSLPLESGTGVSAFPRFFAFCLITGILATAAVIAILTLNYKYSDKLGCTKKRFALIALISFFAAISMLPIWERLIDFLSTAFKTL